MSELEQTKSHLNKAVSDFYKSFFKPELLEQSVKDLEQVVKTIKKLVKDDKANNS